jgi:fructokinase
LENCIGIDLGGTKIEGIALAKSGSELFRKRIATPPKREKAEERYQDILMAIAGLINECRQIAGADAPVGMGIPGSIKPGSNIVQNANTTELIGRALQNDLEKLIESPVAIANDANCFALAEAMTGAGKGFSLVFGVIMGTGCGGGIVYDGRVRIGPNAIAGEWGHVSIDPAGEPCYCGNKGCIETKISGSGLQNSYYRQTGLRASLQEIAEQARQGQTPARMIFDQFLDDFGRALGGLISILDPDCIVLGGGLSNLPELYSAGLKRVKRYTFSMDIRTPIVQNKLGDSAGVIGAAWLARNSRSDG